MTSPWLPGIVTNAPAEIDGPDDQWSPETLVRARPCPLRAVVPGRGARCTRRSVSHALLRGTRRSRVARSRYGDAFAEWLTASFEPIDFVVRLAEERGIVLLDGGGFDAPTMSVRDSQAIRPDAAYEPIGRGIAGPLADYHARWRAAVGG